MTTFELVTYRNLSPLQKHSFFVFCKEASMEKDQPAYNNMWSSDWPVRSNTLPHILEKTSRFEQGGEFFILFDSDQVVACGGVYRSSFCDSLALIGVRTWVHKHYRNQRVLEQLSNAYKKWSIDNDFKSIALTFNHYNKNLIQVFKRARLGEGRKKRSPDNIFHSGLHEVEFPVTIRSTPQWVIFEKLDPSWSFDWKTIEAKKEAA